MAVKSLEEILGSLSADEKKLLDNTLSKHPELKEGWLRQDDYSRNLNKLKEEQAALEEDRAYAERMRAWADVNVPKWEALEKAGVIDPDSGEEVWSAQKAELERQLEEAKKAAVGGDMDPAELDKRVREIVKANGGLTPDELKAVVASEGKKLAEETFTAMYAEKETNFNEKTIPFVAGFSTAMAVNANRYQQETGKTFTADDQKAVFDLMAKEKNFDPYKVMDEYMAPHLAEKQKKVEIDKAVQEELAKRGMPGGGNEPYIPQSNEKGNLQKMLERSGEAGDFESVIAAQAVKAAQELRSEGK